MTLNLTPGFRAPAFGIYTSEQVFYYSVLMAVINFQFILCVCHFYHDWAGRIAGCLLYYGAFLMFVWARLLILGLGNDIGDLCMGLMMLSLSTVLWLMRRKGEKK